MTAKPRIFIVDDDDSIVFLLQHILSQQGYEIDYAFNGKDAINKISHFNPELILLDVDMPEDWDGFRTCEELHKIESIAQTPVLFLSGHIDTESKVKGFAVGAKDFISKPFQNDELFARIKTHIELFRLRYDLEKQVKQKTAEVYKLNQELKIAYEEAVGLLSFAGEYKDPETGQHIKRIGLYTYYLTGILNWQENDRDIIKLASPLHDIGKVGIPDRILRKEGPLTASEWEIMQTHALIGATILSCYTHNPVLNIASDIAMCHHERYDGTGYPKGLKGEEIPIAARITTLVDVYDALRSKRPYKEEISHERATEIILKGDGRTQPEHFDPAILNLFKNHHQQLDGIYQAYLEKQNINDIKTPDQEYQKSKINR